MRIEDYKDYMERVKTTAEMDERVLKNLKDSVMNEGISNKNFRQQPMQRTRTFLYRASVAAVCCLVIFLIGKSYTGMGLPVENSSMKESGQSDSVTPEADSKSQPEADSKSQGAPTFSELYGKEISKYATKCNYVDEDSHIRICIQEIISDECITEIMGYYEAKDKRGKEWLNSGKRFSGFTLSIEPDMSKWPDKRELLDPYYSFDGYCHEKWLESYNTDERTYFSSYFIASPDFQIESVTIGYKLYNIYDKTSIAIENQMKAKAYSLSIGKQIMKKQYKPTELILSPLGGMMIKGKDLGIKPVSGESAGNLSRLLLELDEEDMQSITLIEDGTFLGYDPEELSHYPNWWSPNLLSEKQKKALGKEYALQICRLPAAIDTSKITGIEIDGVHTRLDADKQKHLSPENTVEHSISDDDLNDLLKIIRKYYQKKLSWEVVDYQIADNSHSLYPLYKDYEPGNIIVFEVHTTNNPSGLPYRSIALGRKDKSAKWEVLNEGY